MTRDATKDSPSFALAKGECIRALKKLEELVVAGLRHGFFEYAVICETIKGEKRGLVIKAGESHRFVIPKEEIDNLP